MQCIICKKEVVFEDLQESEIFQYACELADYYGVDSLTEDLQVIYEQLLCSEPCYFKLSDREPLNV